MCFNDIMYFKTTCGVKQQTIIINLIVSCNAVSA